MPIDITSAAPAELWCGECKLSDPRFGEDSFRIRRLGLQEIAYAEERGRELYRKHVEPENEYDVPLYILLPNGRPVAFNAGMATAVTQVMMAADQTDRKESDQYTFEKLIKMTAVSDSYCLQIGLAAAMACGLEMDANGKPKRAKQQENEDDPFVSSKKARRRASNPSGS